MSGHQAQTDYMLWMPEAMRYVVDEANRRNLDAADMRANEILELAITEQDLLSKFNVVPARADSDEDGRIVGSFDELSIIADEDVSGEDQNRLLELAENVDGAENLVDLLRVSHTLVKTEYGGVVEEDSEREHSYNGIIGVKVAIDEKIQNRAVQIGQVKVEAEKSRADIREEIDGLLQLKRTRGNRSTTDIDVQIEELEERITAVSKQAKKDIKQLKKANDLSAKALDKAVERVEASERQILDIAHDRIAARIRQASHMPTDGSVLDMDSYDDFWGASKLADAQIDGSRIPSFLEETSQVDNGKVRVPDVVGDAIHAVDPENGDRTPVANVEPAAVSVPDFLHSAEEEDSSFVDFDRDRDGSGQATGFIFDATGNIVVDGVEEDSIAEVIEAEVVSEEIPEDSFDRSPETDVYSSEAMQILEALNGSDELAELRTNYAKMIAGRKGISFASRKFSKNKLIGAEVAYTTERDTIIIEKLKEIYGVDKLTEEIMQQAEIHTNQVYLKSALNLIDEQLEYSYRQPEEARLRKFFQKWSDSKLNIAKRVLYMAGPAVVAGSVVGTGVGVATGRVFGGLAGGVYGAVSAASAYTGAAVMSGDRALKGINDSQTTVGVTVDDETGESHEVYGYTRDKVAANEALYQVSSILSTDSGSVKEMDNAILRNALYEVRRPGVKRTRMTLAGGAMAITAALGMAGALANIGSGDANNEKGDNTEEITTTTTPETTTTVVSDSEEGEEATPEQIETINNFTPEQKQDFVNYINWATKFEADNPVIVTSDGIALLVGTQEYVDEVQRRWNVYFGVTEETA